MWTPDGLKDDLVQVCQLADLEVRSELVAVDVSAAPHKRPAALKPGFSAAYIFLLDGRALKVGIAGPNSNPRYQYQHYSATSANSTLARSLIADAAMVAEHGFNAETIGAWILANTTRINYIFHRDLPRRGLELLEKFLQCKLDPRYEGRKST